MGFFSRLFGKGQPGAKGAAGTLPRAAPGPIVVASVSDEYAWLVGNPCECGSHWSLVRQSASSSPDLPEHVTLDRLEVACSGCGRRSAFLFQVDTHSPQYLQEQQAMMKELLGGDDGSSGES